jgi:hypothetical protein
MKNKLFLSAGFFFSFLSAYCFSADSLAGKYLYKYQHQKSNSIKQKQTVISGWDYNAEDRTELLTLNANGTFEMERISPQGGFWVVPVTGSWKISAEGVLILSGPQYYDGDYLYFFQKTFSIFNGNLTEKNSENKKSKPPVPWIKQR